MSGMSYCKLSRNKLRLLKSNVTVKRSSLFILWLSLFLASLIFASQVGVYLSEAPYSRLPKILWLACKIMSWRNTSFFIFCCSWLSFFWSSKDGVYLSGTPKCKLPSKKQTSLKEMWTNALDYFVLYWLWLSISLDERCWSLPQWNT